MDTPSKLEQLQARLSELRRQINFHNYRYHVLDDPVVSDYEFDRLLAELRAIEETHPEWVTPDSPTQRAGGAPLSKFERVRHPAPILSLGNAFGEADVRAWYERVLRLDERVAQAEYVVEPKIDGLTVVLHYRNGQFTQGATRGDGVVGEDITANLRTVPSLPLHIPVDPQGPPAPPYLVVRGEVFMTHQDFEELNRRLKEAGEKTYQNPRNTAAGSLRQLDPKLTASRPLNLLTYAIVAGELALPNTQSETLEYLRALGFPVFPGIRQYTSSDQAIAACEQWEQKREQLSFEIDGMVIKINDLELASDLGYVGKDPRGSIAYKFPAEEVTTRLLDIGVNVGRTGVLTPYANLDPVEIRGVIVRQATLHNFDYIADKDIRVGDMVRIKRAGEVIPYVIGPVKALRSGEERVYEPPSTCPFCGEPAENLPGEVAWYCVNAACPAQLIRNLEHFVSRGAMDIVGLGIRIVEQLVAEGLLQDVADLFTLKKEDLLALEGFGEKKADNILQAIESARSRPLSRVITALGIRGVGEVAAADLAQHFAGLDELSQASLEQLQAISGFGPNTAQGIVDWFERPRNQKLLEKLRRAGVWPRRTAEQVPGQVQTLTGRTFVVTGTLPEFSRSEAKAFIEAHGGKVTGSVSGNTDYLVLGENPGSKYDQAQALGIPVIDEVGLRRLALGSSQGRPEA